MMIKKVLLVALGFCSLAVAAGEPKQAELKVDIYQWGADTVLLYRTSWSEGSRQECDTLVMADGRLSYRVALTEPVWVMLLPKGVGRFETKAVTTAIFPGSKQRIDGQQDKKGVLHYTAKGSDRYFSDAAIVRSLLLPTRLKMDSVDMALLRAKKEQREALLAKRRVLGEAIDSLKLLFLERFPSSPVAGELLGSARYSDKFFDYEKRLSFKVRGGVFKAQIDDWAAKERAYQAVQRAKDSIVVGAEAPPIELPDSSGVVHTLAQMKGRWVVVDFWGSWCGWCIKGIPAMKVAHEKYGAKVAFFGVACNDKEEPWRGALVKYGFPWINVFDGGKGVESTSVRYGVEGYPTKVVVNPEGKIALKVVGEDPQFYAQLEQLINKQ